MGTDSNGPLIFRIPISAGARRWGTNSQTRRRKWYFCWVACDQLIVGLLVPLGSKSLRICPQSWIIGSKSKPFCSLFSIHPRGDGVARKVLPFFWLFGAQNLSQVSFQAWLTIQPSTSIPRYMRTLPEAWIAFGNWCSFCHLWGVHTLMSESFKTLLRDINFMTETPKLLQ